MNAKCFRSSVSTFTNPRYQIQNVLSCYHPIDVSFLYLNCDLWRFSQQQAAHDISPHCFSLYVIELSFLKTYRN